MKVFSGNHLLGKVRKEYALDFNLLPRMEVNLINESIVVFVHKLKSGQIE
jgi:hypothetical protein